MPPRTKVTNVRLLSLIRERTDADPIAALNMSAFVRALVDAFIAREARIESTRLLGMRHRCATDETTTGISLPAELHQHYKAYAAAQGESLGSLIMSALALHYFGAAPAPQPAPESPLLPAHPDSRLQPPASQLRTPPALRNPKIHRAGWRQFLLALDLGQTRDVDLHGRDPGNTRRALHNTAAIIRQDSLPRFAITSRLTPRTLSITRLG